MYAIVRRYQVPTAQQEEVVRRVDESWLGVVHTMPGFQSYYVMKGGPEELLSVTMFEDKETSNDSALANRRWQQEHLVDQEVVLLDSWNGEVLVHGAR
jgi:heme-degrading monooxygenase HmoA